MHVSVSSSSGTGLDRGTFRSAVKVCIAEQEHDDLIQAALHHASQSIYGRESISAALETLVRDRGVRFPEAEARFRASERGREAEAAAKAKLEAQAQAAAEVVAAKAKL